MKSREYWMRVITVAVVVCAFSAVVSAQAIEPKRLVVLYWDNKEFPGNARFEESFKTRLQLGKRQDVEYFPEYFELSRFPEEKHILTGARPAGSCPKDQ
jgi:hypothetical protein